MTNGEMFFMFFLSMSQCFAEAVISLWMSVKARFQTPRHKMRT